jgi:glutathione S-transferase
MKLFYSPTSPYARKVLVAAHERGLAGSMELRRVDPWSDPQELQAANPLGKVPVLVTDDGTSIADSTIICEYLDALGEHEPLIGPDRLGVLTRAAVAQGLMDAAVTAALERRRPDGCRWDDWAARQLSAIERTLPTLPLPPPGRFDLGDISLACALGYFDLRLRDFDWRSLNGELGHWLDGINDRPSMLATKPE